jgi:hypothetical protein
MIDTTYINPSPWSETGTYEVAICATNSSVIYVCSMGYVYKTADKSVTTTRTALAQQVNLAPNAGSRQTGPGMAIDPINPNVCWLMTLTGARRTIDGGASWTNISTASLPAPTLARAFIAFDRSPAVSSDARRACMPSSTALGFIAASMPARPGRWSRAGRSAQGT